MTDATRDLGGRIAHVRANGSVLLAKSGGGARKADRCDNVAGVATDRYGDAADAVLVLDVIDRVTDLTRACVLERSPRLRICGRDPGRPRGYLDAKNSRGLTSPDGQVRPLGIDVAPP